MKIRHEQDERVVMQKRKILSEAYAILMFLLMGSILVKQFVLKGSFADYCVEFIGYFGISIYVLVRNLASGNNLFKINKSKGIIITIVFCAMMISVICTIITVDLANVQDALKSILINFAVTAIVMFSMYFILNQIGAKRQKKLENKFDDDIS